MNRYIVIAYQSCAVFFDEVADNPRAAIKVGEARIGAESTNLEPCEGNDADALYCVYHAPIGFGNVTANDASMVVKECEYISTYRKAA